MPRSSSTGSAARCRRPVPVVVGLLEDLERARRRLAGADHDVDVDRLALLDVGRDRAPSRPGPRGRRSTRSAGRRPDAQRSWRSGPARAGCRGSRCRRRGRRSAARCPRGSVARASLTAAPRSVFSGSIVLSIAQQVELARGRRDLDPRLPAEDDHAGQVVLPPLLRGLGRRSRARPSAARAGTLLEASSRKIVVSRSVAAPSGARPAPARSG